MGKKICKLASVFLIITLVLPAVTYAADYNEYSAPVNDPGYKEQWGPEFIRGPAVPTYGIVIAVIDSGIYRGHPDLYNVNILPGRNFIVSTCGYCRRCGFCILNLTRPVYDTDDESGHGTYVTGVIAATIGNVIDTASDAYGVTIMPLRVATGVNNFIRYSAVAAAIHYAVEEGVHIINISLGTVVASPAVRGAVDHAAANGVWMVAAAGNYGHINGGTASMYPASFADVIGVGTITRYGQRWYRSQQNDSVFVVMPGENILTTGLSDYTSKDEGTSLSAPKITALAAIARTFDPDMPKAAFRNMLIDSAIPKGYPTHDADNRRVRNDQYGYGVVDAGLFMYNLTRRNYIDFIDAEAGAPCI